MDVLPQYLNILRSLSIFLFLWMPLSASAATWLHKISVPVTLDYDTNPLMLGNNRSSLWKSTVNPKYSFKAVQEGNQWNTDFSMKIERSSDVDISINRDDPSLGVGWSHELERGQIGIRINYDENSSRATTLDETGRAGSQDSTRITKSIGMDWQYLLSESISVATTASASWMSFQMPGGGDASPGSRSYAGSASLYYQLDERFQPYIQITANRSEPDGDLSPTSVYGAVAGLKWQPSDLMTFNTSGGMNQVVGDSNGRGWQASASLAYAFERSSLSMSLSHSISPAGNGGFISSDQISGDWTYTLSDLDRGGLNFSMRQNHGSSKGQNHRLSIWYGRDLTKVWDCRVTYQFKESSTDLAKVNGQVFGISLGYNFSEY